MKCRLDTAIGGIRGISPVIEIVATAIKLVIFTGVSLIRGNNSNNGTH